MRVPVYVCSKLGLCAACDLLCGVVRCAVVLCCSLTWVALLSCVVDVWLCVVFVMYCVMLCGLCVSCLCCSSRVCGSL